MILVKIKGMGDPTVTLDRYDDGSWFVADSFSFGVDREPPGSGDKGGTEDINIGVGELQPLSIVKALDAASVPLAQAAVNGNAVGNAEMNVVAPAGSSGQPFCYLKYVFDRVFVSSWSTSADADDRPAEEVTLHFSKVAFSNASTADGVEYTQHGVMSWDRMRHKRWRNSRIKFKSPHGFS